MLRRYYGISQRDYDAMRTTQGSLCAICQKPQEKMCVDHCHSTGKVRALLCTACNTQLGHIEKPTYEHWFSLAMKYLSKFPREVNVGLADAMLKERAQ